MKRILYVEDNLDTANVVKLILSQVGYVVDVAHTGKEGIKKAHEGVFDLLLLDVMLPDMSGWDIYAQLKGKVKAKYAFLSAIPVSAERMEQLAAEGVSDYITEPFLKSDLVTRVNKMLELG